MKYAPSACTARLSVCGLVSSGSLLALGSSMVTECFITGTVMMNTMSSTSMTSMNGIMLISPMTSSVLSLTCPATALSFRLSSCG